MSMHNAPVDNAPAFSHCSNSNRNLPIANENMSRDNDSYEAGLSRIEDTVELAQNTELVTQVSSTFK